MDEKVPSLWQLAFNLTETAKDVVVNAARRGIILAPPDVVDKRHEICFSCEFLKKDNGANICTRCGCHLNLKSRLQGAKCPESRWET